MTTRFAVDTSVTVAYLDAGRSAHRICREYLADKSAVLSGHAAFESFAVLTRLPGATRVAPSDAAMGLRAAFGEPCWLSGDAQTNLFARIGSHGLRGGVIYDALVGETARLSGRTLITRDRRALPTYTFLGIDFVVVDG